MSYIWVHSSLASSSSEFLRSLLLPDLFRAEPSSTQGFGPLRNITKAQPHPGGGSHCLRFFVSVPRLSQPLDGLLRPLARGLISSHTPRTGFAPFRGFSPRAAVPVSSTGRAPLPFNAPSSPVSQLPDSAPRLRGLTPHEAAFDPVWCYPPQVPLPSSVFSLLQVVPYGRQPQFPKAIRS